MEVNIEEVKKLIDMLNIYIWGGIGVAVIIVLIIFINKLYEFITQRSWEWLKKRLLIPKNMSKKTRENIKFINDLVVDTRRALNADRCYVFEFHNGKYFSSTESRWKVTQVYESCADGVSSQGRDFKDIDVSMLWSSFEAYFSHTNDKLSDGISVLAPNKRMCINKKKCEAPKRLYMFEVDKLSNRFHASILIREGVDIMIHAPILNSKNEVVGVIGVDYQEQSEFEKVLNDENISFCHLCRAADQVAFSWTLTNTKTK